jgi:penicillin G amidase
MRTGARSLVAAASTHQIRPWTGSRGLGQPIRQTRSFRPAVVVIALAMLTALLADAHAARAAPPTQLPGLLDDADIARDVRGIAHISAANDHDLFFLQGWTQAADRLFQMDVGRRVPSGTFAELVGPSALASDVQYRTLGLRRAATRSLPLLETPTRTVLDAFADGVNAWVASHPLPPEYQTLRLDAFSPWTALDSVTVGKWFSFLLSFGLDIRSTLDYLAYTQTGSALGFDGGVLFSQDVFRVASFTDASSVPDAGGSAPLRADSGPGLPSPRLGQSVARLARGWLNELRHISSIAPILDPSMRSGSNEWVIAGSISASGSPMLANDPHLPLVAPSILYPIHLRNDTYDVYGESFAGAPGVILGHNRFVSWGATNNPMDVTDTFAERIVHDPTSPSGLSTVYRGTPEHVIAIPEEFRANVGGVIVDVPPGSDIPAATLIVPRRNLGPIVALDASSGTALSVQYAGFAGTREIEASLSMDRARTVDQFRTALERFDVGSENFAVIDGSGDIAMLTAGEMPLREDLEAGTVHGLPPWFIRDGTGGNEWLPARTSYPGQALAYEILPQDEMPHVLNPPSGFFVNANDDPAGTTLDNDPLNQLRPTGGIYYLNAMNPEYLGFRAGRIAELLDARIEAGSSISFSDMQQMQSDVGLIDAEVFVPHILHAWDRAQDTSMPELAALAGDAELAEAVGRLEAWDHTTPTGIPKGYDASDKDGTLDVISSAEVSNSVAATIYAVWRARIVNNTIDRTLLAIGLNPPDDFQTLTALRRLFDRYPTDHGIGASGVDFFEVSGVSDPDDRRDILVLQSLREALDRLASPAFAAAFAGSTDQDDYRWGRLHRIVFGHLLDGPFSVPPAGGAFPDPVAGLSGIPTDGGFETVDAASHEIRGDSADAFMFDFGPARRSVAEVSPAIARSRWVSSLPGGTSGVVGDPHHVDLLPAWLTDELYPQFLRKGDLLPTYESIERFAPA